MAHYNTVTSLPRGTRMGTSELLGTPNYGAGAKIERPYLFSLGLSSYHMSRIVAQAYGNQIGSLIDQISNYGQRMVGTNSYELRWKSGNNTLVQGRVVNTITPAGVGLQEVILTIAGPQESNIPWWSIGAELVSSTGRHFIIVDIEQGDGGFQQARLRPLDGRGVTVAGNAAIDFPDGSLFGELGIKKGVNCYNPVNMRMVEDDEHRNYITRMVTETRRDRATMQNDIVALPMQVEGYEGIVPFMYERDKKAMMDMERMEDATVIWGQMNQNPDVNALAGAGLIQQIPDELKMPYIPAKLNYKTFERFIYQWDLQNPDYLSKDIAVLCGSAAYFSLQQMFDSAFRPEFRQEPRNSPEEAGRAIWGGFKYDGFRHALGYNFHMQRCRAFDDPWIDGRNGFGIAADHSIHSHDILFMDMGVKKNYSYTAGAVVGTPEYKIQTYCPMNPNGTMDHRVAVYTDGLTDENGNMRSGRVLNFGEDSVKHFESSFAINLEDPTAAFYLSPSL